MKTKDAQIAIELATGKRLPKPKSVVNNVTEYGALFNRLNTERTAKGLPPDSRRIQVAQFSTWVRGQKYRMHGSHEATLIGLG